MSLKSNNKLGTSITLLIVGIMIASTTLKAQEDTGNPEQESTLVQNVYDARKNYQASLERLHAYYTFVNDVENRMWVETELKQFHMVLKSPYVLEMDLPSKELQPTQNIPQANRLIAEALSWMDRGLLSKSKQENYKRAELLLRRLIENYPKSDKVDDCCFYLGEIYSSKYYEQYRRATGFYERVLVYDPNSKLDARMRAGILYETKLANRNRAIELYQEVLQREIDVDQTTEAKKRLSNLLGESMPNIRR